MIRESEKTPFFVLGFPLSPYSRRIFRIDKNRIPLAFQRRVPSGSVPAVPRQDLLRPECRGLHQRVEIHRTILLVLPKSKRNEAERTRHATGMKRAAARVLNQMPGSLSRKLFQIIVNAIENVVGGIDIRGADLMVRAHAIGVRRFDARHCVNVKLGPLPFFCRAAGD
jgi:hypothetical protein